jgi:hypothetical protein
MQGIHLLIDRGLELEFSAKVIVGWLAVLAVAATYNPLTHR